MVNQCTESEALLTLMTNTTAVAVGTTLLGIVRSDLSGKALGILYHSVIPDVEKLLEAVDALIKEIAEKIKHGIDALVSITGHSDANVQGKRYNYCKVTLKIDDPFALDKERQAVLAELWNHRKEWRVVKSKFMSYSKIQEARGIAEDVKTLHKHCIELDNKATSSSTRLLTHNSMPTASSTTTHTLLHVEPGKPVQRVAVERKAHDEPMVWV